MGSAARARAALVAAALLLSSTPAPAAEPGGLPRISTNQEYLEEAMRPAALDVADLKAVFAHVLASLPPRVKVYPTENYFYFSFMHGHVRYAGNIRLDVHDRDKGRVNFAYFEDLTEWKAEEQVKHALLSQIDGVIVERIDRLLYRITAGEKSVVFELNDLAAVKPPPGLLGPDERFIGPIFDESGIRFLLVYNGRMKIFHYLLDESAPVAERFRNATGNDRILIGKRTGFAFYRDHRIDRKILIGVFEGNARVNNYFDGPFDQLPDNFIEGETLRSAILEVEPRLKGRIDYLGISPGGADRYMIAPYRFWRDDEDLAIFHGCAVDTNVPKDMYYGCFVFLEQDPSATAPAATEKAPPKAPRANPAKADRQPKRPNP